VGLAIVGALLLMTTVASQKFQDYFDAIWKVIPWQFGAILGLIALASHIASAILASIEKEKIAKLPETFSERMKVSMNCPRCADVIQLPLGHGACPHCKLAIHIECDEPRCECGYLLHKLTGVNCPECGSEVPEKLRWKSAQQSTPST
jgi:Zn finger protein HypA/HybF involved in hydrogenase expression